MEEKYVIWEINGGLGKNIAATSLIKSLASKYPDRNLIMVVSFPEVFLNFKEIKRVYPIGMTTYFYEDYIENKDTIIFKGEAYDQTNHILKKQHIIKSWCDILGLEYKNQIPEIKFNYPQRQEVHKWSRPKPILLLQTNGGPSGQSPKPYNWSRDMPVEIAQIIVEKYSNSYHIIQITHPDGYQIPGIGERLDKAMSNMELFSLIAASSKRILIDSSIQHAAAAMNLPSTVFWITTSPTLFGYKFHTNIIGNLNSRANQLINSYTFDYQFAFNDGECPFENIEEVFDLKEISNRV